MALQRRLEIEGNFFFAASNFFLVSNERALYELDYEQMRIRPGRDVGSYFGLLRQTG